MKQKGLNWWHILFFAISFTDSEYIAHEIDPIRFEDTTKLPLCDGIHTLRKRDANIRVDEKRETINFLNTKTSLSQDEIEDKNVGSNLNAKRQVTTRISDDRSKRNRYFDRASRLYSNARLEKRNENRISRAGNELRVARTSNNRINRRSERIQNHHKAEPDSESTGNRMQTRRQRPEPFQSRQSEEQQLRSMQHRLTLDRRSAEYRRNNVRINKGLMQNHVRNVRRYDSTPDAVVASRRNRIFGNNKIDGRRSEPFRSRMTAERRPEPFRSRMTAERRPEPFKNRMAAKRGPELFRIRMDAARRLETFRSRMRAEKRPELFKSRMALERGPELFRIRIDRARGQEAFRSRMAAKRRLEPFRSHQLNEHQTRFQPQRLPTERRSDLIRNKRVQKKEESTRNRITREQGSEVNKNRLTVERRSNSVRNLWPAEQRSKSFQSRQQERRSFYREPHMMEERRQTEPASKSVRTFNKDLTRNRRILSTERRSEPNPNRLIGKRSTSFRNGFSAERRLQSIPNRQHDEQRIRSTPQRSAARWRSSEMVENNARTQNRAPSNRSFLSRHRRSESQRSHSNRDQKFKSLQENRRSEMNQNRQKVERRSVLIQNSLAQDRRADINRNRRRTDQGSASIQNSISAKKRCDVNRSRQTTDRRSMPIENRQARSRRSEKNQSFQGARHKTLEKLANRKRRNVGMFAGNKESRRRNASERYPNRYLFSFRNKALVKKTNIREMVQSRMGQHIRMLSSQHSIHTARNMTHNEIAVSGKHRRTIRDTSRGELAKSMASIILLDNENIRESTRDLHKNAFRVRNRKLLRTVTNTESSRGTELADFSQIMSLKTGTDITNVRKLEQESNRNDYKMAKDTHVASKRNGRGLRGRRNLLDRALLSAKLQSEKGSFVHNSPSTIAENPRSYFKNEYHLAGWTKLLAQADSILDTQQSLNFHKRIEIANPQMSTKYFGSGRHAYEIQVQMTPQIPLENGGSSSNVFSDMRFGEVASFVVNCFLGIHILAALSGENGKSKKMGDTVWNALLTAALSGSVNGLPLECL